MSDVLRFWVNQLFRSAQLIVTDEYSVLCKRKRTVGKSEQSMEYTIGVKDISIRLKTDERIF